MRLRILLSYWYYRDHDVDALMDSFPERPEVFADSGGYSARSVGADVNLEDYVTWVKRWGHHLDCYANLDVIGDAQASYDNQQRMEDAGTHPLPVFHGGEPWPFYEGYLERYSYVCLGGMVATSPQAAMRWIVRCHLMARDADVRLHGFGQTAASILRAVPWYSVDSSSWGSGHMYGVLDLWDDKRCKFVGISLRDHKRIYEYASLIRAHGGDPAHFASRDFMIYDRHGDIDAYRGQRAEVVAVNVNAWLRLESWLRRHHGAIPPPRGMGSSEGVRIFLADSRGGVEPERQDLKLAADWLTNGPKVILAAATAEQQLADAAHALGPGPKIYFVDDMTSNLHLAADAASRVEG